MAFKKMTVKKPKIKGMKKISKPVPKPPPGGDMAEAFSRHMDVVQGLMSDPIALRKMRDYDENVPASNKKMLGIKKI